MSGRLLVLKATHAADAPERAHLACNVAAVGLASGLEVHLFLAVEGVWLALPDLDDAALTVAEGPPIAELLEAIYAAGTVTACTPCLARRGLTAADLREGTRTGGSAQFLDLATRPEATALVY